MLIFAASNPSQDVLSLGSGSEISGEYETSVNGYGPACRTKLSPLVGKGKKAGMARMWGRDGHRNSCQSGEDESHCRALTSVRHRALFCLPRSHECPSEAVSASKDGRRNSCQSGEDESHCLMLA